MLITGEVIASAITLTGIIAGGVFKLLQGRKKTKTWEQLKNHQFFANSAVIMHDPGPCNEVEHEGKRRVIRRFISCNTKEWYNHLLGIIDARGEYAGKKLVDSEPLMAHYFTEFFQAKHLKMELEYNVPRIFTEKFNSMIGSTVVRATIAGIQQIVRGDGIETEKWYSILSLIENNLVLMHQSAISAGNALNGELEKCLDKYDK